MGEVQWAEQRACLSCRQSTGVWVVAKGLFALQSKCRCVECTGAWGLQGPG